MPVGKEGGPTGFAGGTGVCQGWKDISRSSSWSECKDSLGDSITSSVWGAGSSSYRCLRSAGHVQIASLSCITEL